MQPIIVAAHDRFARVERARATVIIDASPCVSCFPTTTATSPRASSTSPPRSPRAPRSPSSRPRRDRSGASNSLTLDRPLMVRRAPSGFLFVNGTPTDCVHLAVTGLLDQSAGPRDLRHQPGREHGRRHDLLRHRSPPRPKASCSAFRRSRSRSRRRRPRISKRRPRWRSSSSIATSATRSGARLLNVNVPDMPRADAQGLPRSRGSGRRHKAENVVKTVRIRAARPSTGSAPPAPPRMRAKAPTSTRSSRATRR